MNEAAAYRQILEDLIRTAQGALELVEPPDAMVSSSPEEILAFKREHPNCTMIIGDFEIHCLDPGRYGLEDSTVDIDREKALFRRAIQALSQEEKQAFRDYLDRELAPIAHPESIKPADHELAKWLEENVLNYEKWRSEFVNDVRFSRSFDKEFPPESQVPPTLSPLTMNGDES